MKDYTKAVLINQYHMLDDLLKNINNNVYLIKPDNGKWSVFENIAHLGRYNEIFFGRMQEIQHKNNPEIESYKADEEPGFIEWCSKPFVLGLADFYSSRETLMKFFEMLSDKQMQKAGTHTVYGELTTEQWLQFFLLHEAHHFLTIFKLVHQKK